MNERKFINEAVKKLLVSEYIKKETENAGFGGMEMKRTPFGTNITLYANKPGLVIGRHGSKVQEITENLEKKYHIESPQIEVKEIDNPDLNPQVVSKKIALSLEKGWAYRKAGNTSLRRIAENGARGVIISISGKISGERGRMQKFMTGSVKYSGEPARAGMEHGFSIAKLKLGVIGVKVGILKSNYKLPDDYSVSQELGVSTPKLIQEPEPEKVKPPEAEKPEPKQVEKPRPPSREKEKPRIVETPDKETKKPKEVEKKEPQKKEPEAEKKPEKKEEPAKEKEVKAEAEPPKAEEAQKVKAEEKKPEPKEPAVEAEPKKVEAVKPEAAPAAEEKKKATKSTSAKAKKTAAGEKKAAKKTTKKSSSAKKESKSTKKKEPKEEKVEKDGTEGKEPETDEQ